MIRSCIGALCALSLAACATAPPTTGTAAPSAAVVPSGTEAAASVAETGARIADALQVAPPAAVTKAVTIDDKAIRLAFRSWDTTLSVIDAFVAGGALPYRSPRALMVKGLVDRTTAYLVAASSAQRVGDAKSYTAALAQAKAATASIQAALNQ